MDRKGTSWPGGGVMREGIERGRNKFNICNKNIYTQINLTQ